MFYRLKSDYMLRGWKGMAWVLLKRPENQTRPIDQDTFQLLILCDGETELPGNLLNEKMKKLLLKYVEDGIIEPCEKTTPLNKEQYYHYYNNRYVLRAFWSVTGRCNYRCRHCYIDGPDGKLGEMSTEQALNLIDQMAECGILRVDITGGEPLVRNDIWQIMDHILSYKMTIGAFFTNGWLLNERVLNEFEKRGIKPEIAISFDGVGWHDWMRGVPGAEEAALQAIRLCKKKGFTVSIAMCIHRGNVHTLPKTVEVLNSLGVSYIKTANVDMTDLWRCHSDGNAMTKEEYIEAMMPYIEWYYKAGRPIPKLEFGGVAALSQNAPGEVNTRCFDGTENCLNDYMCGAVRWSCYITPEGRLLPCMPMTDSPQQEKFPLVQDIGLKQGLSDSYYMQ